MAAKSLHGIATGQSAPDTIAVTWVAGGVLLTLIGPLFVFLGNRSWPLITWQQVVEFHISRMFCGWLGCRASSGNHVRHSHTRIRNHSRLGRSGGISRTGGAKVYIPELVADSQAVTCWLLIMYSIFAICVSLAFKTVWLFISFWMLIGNKFIEDWLTPVSEMEERKSRHIARWGTSAALYLFLVFGSVLSRCRS